MRTPLKFAIDRHTDQPAQSTNETLLSNTTSIPPVSAKELVLAIANFYWPIKKACRRQEVQVAMLGTRVKYFSILPPIFILGKRFRYPTRPTYDSTPP